MSILKMALLGLPQVRGRIGNGAEPFLSFIVQWTIGADYEPVTLVAAWYTGREAR